MWIGVIKEPIGFFTEGKYFWGITLCTDIWKELGWNAIIFISAITSISQDMYEAADIDGATRAQKMWHITIKSIKPTIILMFIFQVGGILNANFDQIMMLTKQMGNSMLKEYADVLDTFIIVWVSARVVSPSQQRPVSLSLSSTSHCSLVPTT